MAHSPPTQTPPLTDNTLAWLALEVEDAVARYTVWRRQHPKMALNPTQRAGIQQRLITDVLKRLNTQVRALERYLDHPVRRYLAPTAVAAELAERFRWQDTTP